MYLLLLFVFVFNRIEFTSGYPEEGKWFRNISNVASELTIPKSLFKGSQIFIQITCTSKVPTSVAIEYKLIESRCWNDHPPLEDIEKLVSAANEKVIQSEVVSQNCSGHIMLKTVLEGKGPPTSTSALLPVQPDSTNNSKNKEKSDDSRVEKRNVEESESVKKPSHPKGQTFTPVFKIARDGFYTLVLKMAGSPPDAEFNAYTEVDMKGTYGYLSAADWPLLPFYGIMCLVYVLFGAIWLIVSFCQWRDLLRIQFWIGGVILLGMLEKATFYAEYQSINNTGISVKGAVLLAEWVSCAKRTLARMLVIIVSLGFGIVKPRLGPMLHRVVGAGACYFILAVVESYIRIMHPKNDPSNQLLIASIPLAVLDSAICWWIFTSLVQTTRTLRLRRNLVKLNLYRHFTNTLIFAVLASVIFMLYSIKAHRLAICITDWKELWVDEAYWHVLFSVLLLVIMILWRPTNNNQRYAFTPLLDAAEDDEEEDQFVNDAYGVKMRSHSRASSPKPKPGNDDDILKWVDENIPSAGVETALPILDSEEEELTTKFEMSKMQ